MSKKIQTIGLERTTSDDQFRFLSGISKSGVYFREYFAPDRRAVDVKGNSVSE